MYKNLIELSEICQNEELCGGKAHYLFLLKKNGFNVPDAIVLNAIPYGNYIQGKDDSEQLNRAILKAIDSKFGTKRVIFRSSANIENTDDTSSAGVFESFVYEKENAPYQYLKRIWDSSLNEKAKGYYELTGINKDNVKMAVIIQQYISGQIAAVIQSFDIVNELPIMLIEYASGSTSAIVDGTIDAEFISVSRDNRIVEKPETVPFGMDIVIELNNSIKILEDLLKSHVEVEIQIENNVIYYLQVRKLL